MSFGEVWQETLQAGVEPVAGTEAAATRILYATDITFTRERASTAHAFATGTRSRVRANTLQAVQAGGELTLGMSADELVEFALITLMGGETPTQLVAAEAYQWDFTDGNTLNSATFQYNDGANLWKLLGAHGEGMTFAWAVGGENTVTIPLFARAKDTLSALTGALSHRVPTFIEGWETNVYIDALGATPMTTLVPGVAISGSIELVNNLGRIYTAMNTLNPRGITIGELGLSGTVRFLAETATALSEYANWDGEVPRLITWEWGMNEQLASSTTNEVQALTATGTVSGGTYTLAYRGQTTGNLAYNASNATVQAALDALLSVPATGAITVGGGPFPGTPLTFTFTGPLSGLNVDAIVRTSAVTGGGSIAMSTTTPGVGYKRAVRLTVPCNFTTVDTGQDEEGVRAYEMGFNYLYDVSNGFAYRLQLINGRSAAW